MSRKVPLTPAFFPTLLLCVGAMSTIGIYNMIYGFGSSTTARNKQIVQRMQSCIQSKESIVIWPKNLIQKDINDMVLAGENPYAIIKSNTYSGLEAQIKFTDWKKV
ncbi:MAG: hypothetical protein CM15mV7_1160 [uncultured marine virus]|nr:MAG: hypothetical protein CM15mV7_1160 [uncultured marine virus]